MLPVSVVLVETRNPLNIGAVARAMSNFGFFDLRLVNTYRVAVDEARSAVGAAELLNTAREYSSLAAAIEDVSIVIGTTNAEARSVRRPLQRLEAGARAWLTSGEPMALLFGSEKHGLSVEHISYCNSLWRIPSRKEHGSINLGQAVAITLYELIRQEQAPAPEEPSRAPQAELRRFETLLLEALTESGYVHSPSTVEKVRRMVLDLKISRHDADVWQGMIRQILWKLRHNLE